MRLGRSEEGDLGSEPCRCPSVHLVTRPHQLLSYVEIVWLATSGRVDAVMVTQRQQTCGNGIDSTAFGVDSDRPCGNFGPERKEAF